MLLLPIGDENPTRRQPVVNWVLIGLNAFLFLATAGDGLQISRWAIEHLGLWPGDPRPHQFLSSMFMHGDLFHLLGNMLFLWICGDNVEDALGRAWYAVFYLGCGLAADGAHLLLQAGGNVPMIGASGAVSGVLGAYVLLYPNHQIKLLWFWFWFYWGTFYVSAKWAIGLWFAKEILGVALTASRVGGGVAHLAHVGGFVAGALVALALREVLLARLGAAPAPARRAPVRDADFGPIPDGLDERGAPVYGAPPRRAAPFQPGPAGRFAVLATAEEPIDAPAAGGALAQALGLGVAEAARAVAAAPWFLARDVDEPAARAAVQALARVGVPAVARGEAELRPLPDLLEVPRAVFDAEGFECETARGFVRVRHDDCALLAVGLVRRAAGSRRASRGAGVPDGNFAEVLTVFVRGGPRLLFVEDDTVAKLVRPGWGMAAGLPVRGIVVRLLTHAPRADRNAGAEILAGGARARDWTGLVFGGFGEYEAYTAWLWQIRGR